MKKLVAVTIISVILLAAVITNATAESEKQDFNLENANKETETTSTTTLNVRTLNNRNDNKTITQIKVQRIGKDHPKWKGFEMKGNISNLSSFSFDINGISIIMDATITGKLQIKGTLADGSFVKVEGKVINEKYYAKEIKINNNKGSEKDEDKNEIEDDGQIYKTREISITPTPKPHSNRISTTNRQSI